MVYISRINGPDGEWEIFASEQGVTGISNRVSCVRGPENEHSALAAEQLLEYFRGERTVFTVPLDLSGTPFQRSVWEELHQIPYGESVSYGHIAERIGRPKAVRAVGQAVGRNPCLILVPCHRILGKDGSLTGFSAGVELKRFLLDLEEIPYR